MKVSEQIKEKLGQGESVFSCALGRIGEIVSVEDSQVFINSVKGFKAVTTFDRGDKVNLVKSECKDYDWQIINEGW